MIIETNYVTQEQFKREVRAVAEEGKCVYNLLGRLQAAFGLAFDKETSDLMVKIIENTHK